MENTITSAQIPALIKKNWFKILVASLLVFLFMKRDFSFQFNINAPELKNGPARLTPVQQPEKKKEYFSEDTKTSSKTTIREKMGMFLNGDKAAPTSSLKIELDNVNKDIKVAYLKRFAHVALAECKKFGVPPSIILANALLNSTAGNRDFVSMSNNHFGITCSNDWKNSTISYEGVCYRQYENAWASFRDHSQYITTGRFAHLKDLHIEDYKGWARALDKAGFSDEPNFDESLIKIIEAFSLHQLDKK